MSARIARVSGELKLHRVFTCDVCGAEALGGSAARVQINNPPENLENLSEKFRYGPYHDMPSGWASFYGNPHDIVKCRNCK